MEYKHVIMLESRTTYWYVSKARILDFEPLTKNVWVSESLSLQNPIIAIIFLFKNKRQISIFIS